MQNREKKECVIQVLVLPVVSIVLQVLAYFFCGLKPWLAFLLSLPLPFQIYVMQL